MRVIYDYTIQSLKVTSTDGFQRCKMGIVSVTSNRHRRVTVPKRGHTASEVRTIGYVARHMMVEQGSVVSIEFSPSHRVTLYQVVGYVLYNSVES